MSGTSPQAGATPEQLREQIAHTRAELADTVDALAAKADVKAQARNRLEEITDSAKELGQEWKDRATGLLGGARQRATGLAEQVRDRARDLAGSSTATSPGAMPTTDSGSHAAGTLPPTTPGPTIIPGPTTTGATSGGDGSDVRHSLGAAAAAAAGAASGAATRTRQRIDAARSERADGKSETGSGLSTRRSTTMTAGSAVAAVALLAIVVLVRKRRKADR